MQQTAVPRNTAAAKKHRAGRGRGGGVDAAPQIHSPESRGVFGLKMARDEIKGRVLVYNWHVDVPAAHGFDPFAPELL